VNASSKSATPRHPSVAAVTVNYNAGEWILRSTGSLLAQTVLPQVLVVDNASTDGSIELVEDRFRDEHRLSILRLPSNVGTSSAYNQLIRYRDADYYFILNPDAEAPPTTIESMIAIMESEPSLAILGATLLYFERPTVIQEFAPKLDPLLFPVDPYIGLEMSTLPDTAVVHSAYASAAACLIRADLFRSTGGFDEDFFMFGEEIDLSWRLHLQGWRTGVTPQVRVHHVGGLSAPVGMQAGRYHTSLQRIYLRELNCFASGIKCFNIFILPFYLICNILSLLVEGMVFALLGRANISKTYLRVILDTLRNLKRILAKRHAVQQSRLVPDHAILREIMVPKLGKLIMLRQVGIPRITGFTRKQAPLHD